MFLALDNIHIDLELSNASFSGDERMTVVNGSFRSTLKTANKIIKYLESKGYLQDGLDCGNQRQGAVYRDEADRKISVSVCWGNEVQVIKL